MNSAGYRPPRTAISMVILVALAGAGCGSTLSDQQMLRANSEAFRMDHARSVASEGDAATAAAQQETTGPDGSSLAPTTGEQPQSVGTAAATTPGVAGSRGVATGSGASGSAVSGAASSQSSNPESSAKPGAGAPSASGGRTAGPAPAAPAVPSAGGPKTEIRLGSIGQQSGPIGTALLPIVHGGKAWAADVNARGGVAGHPVRVVFGDDGGDPSRALALAKRMVEQDKVLALFAGQMALTLQAVLPYLEEKKVPFLYNTPASPDDDKSPMVFNATTGSSVGAQWAHVAGLLEYYRGKTKLAIMYCRESPTCPLLAAGAKKYAAAAGMQVVSEQQVSLAQPDFTAEVIAARNAGAEVIIPVLENASVIRVLRSAKRQGWSPIISSQMAVHDERYISVGGADVEGTVVGGEVPWSTSPHPIMAGYRAAIDRYIPGGVKGSMGAAAYVAGRLLEVMAANFPAEPTSQHILDSLWALRGETLGGLLPPITFARDTGHADTNPCIIPALVQNGKFVEGTDYVCPPGYARPGS